MMSTNLFSGSIRITGRARTLALLLAVTVALLIGLLLVASEPAHAALNITVNRNTDEPDLTPGDNACDVSSTTGDQCTFRAAIEEANATTAADTINFNITSGTSAVKTISPNSALPKITNPVTINGYSQPGSSPNTNPQGAINASPLIELDGSNAGTASGLEIGSNADGTVIRGLVINNFSLLGIFTDTLGPSGVKVEGNFIGTNVAGDADEGNGQDGVFFFLTSDATIGGTTPDKRNLISGNGGDGVDISSPGPTGHKVEGNLIGTQKDGLTPLGNSGDGVEIDGSNYAVGGTASGVANTIAFNGQDGVRVSGGSFSTGNRILNNSIHSNDRLGINLTGGKENSSGVTKNDARAKDRDTGPNNLQNFPVLAKIEGTTTTIKGTLKSIPSTATTTQTFTIQFFSSPQKDPSGFGEGKTFLGETSVTTNRRGNASFAFPAVLPTGENVVTATATNDLTGDTSEFSQARVATT